MAVKTAMPITKLALQTTHMVTSALDANVNKYGAVGAALFTNVDDALFNELNDDEKAAKVAFKFLDTNKDKRIEMKDLPGLDECSGLIFTDTHRNSMHAEMREELSKAEVAGPLALEPTEVSRKAFVAWWVSESRYAKQLRRESNFAIDKEQAKVARDYRVRRMEEAVENALGQSEAWLPSDTYLEGEASDLVGLTVDVKGQGRGWVAEYGKKGHTVEQDDEKTFDVRRPNPCTRAHCVTHK